MKKFKKIERKGLPGGPNEQFTYITGVFSTEGYKSDSPDVNNPFNIIDSGNITMEGVDFPVMGTDNLGNSQMMMPGMNYQFPGDQVFEIPMAQKGKSIDDEAQRKYLINWLKARKATGRFDDQLTEKELNEYIKNIQTVQQLTKDEFQTMFPESVSNFDIIGSFNSPSGQYIFDTDEIGKDNPKTHHYHAEPSFLAKFTNMFDGLDSVNSVKIHELTHAMTRAKGSGSLRKKFPDAAFVDYPIEQAIRNIPIGFGDFYDDPNIFGSYEGDPEEILAQLMQYRYNFNVDPNRVFTKDDIEEVMDNVKQQGDSGIFGLDIFTPENIIRLLNEVAAVDSKDTNTMMAQDGIEIPKRIGTRKNADGSKSTHLMATETFDGKNWFSFPTLFQNPDGTWVDMSDRPWEEAYEEAKRRSEVIEFGTDKEAAIKFGEGSWKKQDGGEPTFKYAIPGYDQKEFLRQWTNSPMGQSMLLKSFDGNEKALEELTKKRTGNLDTVSINMDEDLEGLGRYRSNDHSIRLNPSTKDFQQVGDDYESVLLHELSHSQDYTPGSQFNKLTIPLSDQKLIRNLSKNSIKNAEDRKTKKENRYLADPTETRARLNVVRDTYEKFKDEDMPSVFDSEFTPSMLEEVKGTSQFEELQQIFSDEEIIQLLNTVAYQRGNKDFKGYAQLGGGVRNLIKKAGPKVMKYLDNLFGKADDVVKSAPAATKQKGIYQMLPIKKLEYPTHYGDITYNFETAQNALDMLKAQGKYADDVGFDIKDLVGENIQYLGNKSGRTIVNVPLPDGKSQLFYKSTDLAGKGTEGLWQPYGGHATIRRSSGDIVHDWFIKDHGHENFYGSKSYRDIAGNLDRIAEEQGWDMSKQILKSKLKNDPWSRQFGGPVLKKLIKKGAIYLDDVLKRFSDDAGEFVSEIDWAKWNKEIPDNTPLIQEYNLIEQTTKANKTWMKNADGTPFSGTPEQFVQMNSSNFKNAFPEGYQSVYRGVSGEDIEKFGPLGVNTNRTDIGPGIFTGDQMVANSYNFPDYGLRGKIDGHTLNLAMKNSDNSLRLEGLGNWHADLNTIGASKQILKKNIDNLKREIKKLGKNPGDYNPNSASSKEARLESYENFYNNYDEIVSNPVYKRLLEYKKEILEAGKKQGKAPGSNSFSTDDLAVFLEKQGLDNIQLRYVDDGMMGNTNISNQVSGNYLKSLKGNNGMFDMSNPDIYKQNGGEYDPYMDIDSTAQKRRTELTNAINKVVDSQGGDENLRALLTMTAFMENSLGANPDAYGRDYTRGAMSIDDIAYKNMFEKRKGARDYTTSQKKYFDWFEGLGFDLENMDKHLRENVLANVAAARYQYGNAPAALPSKDDAEAMYKYYMDFYNRTDADHRDRFMKGYDAFIKQRKKGGDVEIMDLYKKYLMGGDTSKQGQKVYDKLNRLFYNDAKQSGMSPQNYIMTYLAGNS